MYINRIKIVFIAIFIAAISTIFAVLYFKSQQHSQNSPKDILTIGFGGDTMLGRLVDETISEMKSPNRYAYPWGNLLPLLLQNDFNIVNLETTLTTSYKKVPKVFNYKAEPDKVEILKVGNIDLVNLANNHSGDFSDEGLLETIETLDKTNILHVGAGININEARKPVIVEKNNVKIGILGYTDNVPGWLAAENKPGTNYIRVGDLQTIKPQIESLRPLVDIVIVSCHWGPNMRQRPTQEFINFAHALIDIGVDIIHGHSAHIFQGIEIYKKKIIMYDTGDFVDDYAVDPMLRNDQSFLFKVIIENKKLHAIELIPTLISNMQVNIATGLEKQQILDRMKKLSAEFGVEITDNRIIIQ